MNIATIILAAGNSSRMGTTKQLLPIGNTTLLGVVVKNALLAKTQKTYCVLGSNSEKIIPSLQEYDVEIILNPEYKTGLSSSIVKGINHVKTQNFDAVLIMLGDQPLVDTSFINNLIALFYKNPSCIVASNYAKGVGVPAIFPKEFFNELEKLKGDKGAKELLKAKKEQVYKAKFPVDLIDIDTYEEYLAFKKKQRDIS
ncbi:nucleotidyltransferase family protein [Aquimarina rhabdastrellae]